MATGPAMPLPVVDAARHGSYCPKLCTFACPVTAATGRDDTVPWSFHRTVSDLADGRLDPTDAAPRLTGCTGCLACRQPCVFDQDVPAQVVAARAVAQPRTSEADGALEYLAAGRRPDGTPAPPPVGDHMATDVVMAGHADTAETMQAAARLFEAAGRQVAVVAPEGCCGGLARALGRPSLADDLRDQLPRLVGHATRVIALDPHCIAELRGALPTATVVDIATALAEDLDQLSFHAAERLVTWHDPCVLARGEGVTDAPRRLLAAAGFTVVEPEHRRDDTACSGAGLGMPYLDTAAADATARRRAAQLATTNAVAVTSCARAATLLGQAGTQTADLVSVLADLLEDD